MINNETPANYKVLFAIGRDMAMLPEPGTIVVLLDAVDIYDAEAWVDVEISVYPRLEADVSSRQVHLFGYAAFLSDSSNATDLKYVEQFMAERRERNIAADKLPAFFFTMLRSIKEYRQIVGELGPDEARVVLRSLHDMVEGHDSPIVRSEIRRAKDTELFNVGFLRTAEAYFAWKNAAPILYGLQREEVGRISEELSISFQLAGRPNDHHLTFQFALKENILPKRFAVIIGENGTGKSQTLGRIARAALTGDPALKGEDGSRPTYNRILAFAPTLSSASVFPKDGRRGAKVWYRRFPLSTAGVGRARQATSDLIVQLARTPESIRGTNRFDIFLKALSTIDDSERLSLRARNRGRPIPIRELRSAAVNRDARRFARIDLNKEPVRSSGREAFDLSSGEGSFVRFAALVSLYIENSSLLLLDEPETHLHPRFISQFVSVLDNLLEQTGSAAIIATHSVYFVREAFEDQVVVLRSLEDRTVTVEIPMLRTFGADVGAISHFVFGEDQPSKLARYVEDRIASGRASWDDVFDKYKNELSLELLGQIRETLERRAERPDAE